MKTTLMLLITLLLVTLGCTKQETETKEQQALNGTWKLIEARIINFSTNPTIDYSNKNIVYNFQANGILLVTGGDNAGYPNGEYEYVFGKDYLGGAPSPGEEKILLVKINDSKWTYDLTNRKMTLGKSYVDGADLIFERK